MQVKKDYYKNQEYYNLERFISSYYQIESVIDLNENKILEIGIGNKVVSNYLTSIGKEVTTYDFDASLDPDIVGDVRNVSLPDNSYDIIMACQVLEHIHFDDFEKVLSSFSKISKKYVIISLPWRSTYFELIIKFPFIRTILKRNFIDLTLRKSVKFPGFKKSGQHYWEIDQKQFNIKDVKKKINKYFKIKKEFSPILHKYHHFFILERK